MPDPRVGFCIFCDNIRQEVGNKISLMGLYGAEITFAAPAPGILPTFAMMAHLICDPDDVPTVLRLRVVHVDGTELVNNEQPVTINLVRPDSKKVVIHAAVQLTNFLVPREGDIEVYLETDGQSLRAGRLAVKFPTPDTPTSPSSEPPPTRQFRVAAKKKARKRTPSRP